MWSSTKLKILNMMMRRRKKRFKANSKIWEVQPTIRIIIYMKIKTIFFNAAAPLKAKICYKLIIAVKIL